MTTSNYLLKSIIVLLFVLVIGTPLFYLRQSVYPYTTTKTFFFQAVVELIFFLWLALAIIDARYRPKMTPFLWALSAFLAVLFVTGMLGVDPWRSFWSTQERVLGIFAFLHGGALTLVASSLSYEARWRRLCAASLGAAAFVAVIALIQFKIPNLLLQEFSEVTQLVAFRPGSTFGNPTFLAGYLLFHVFIGMYLMFDKYREIFGVAKSRDTREKQSGNNGETVVRRKRTRLFNVSLLFFYCVSTFICIVGLFITQTRGDILGFAFGIFVFLILLAISPPEFGPPLVRRRWLYGGIVLMLLFIGILFTATRTYSFWGYVPGIRRFQDISLDDQALAPRLHALT